jgi:SRSO17 transposase
MAPGRARAGQVLAVQPSRRHPPTDLIRYGKIRWRIEHDYRELKIGLGLDHFEGRSFTGWHRHATLVTAAHLSITTLRLNPKADAPA